MSLVLAINFHPNYNNISSDNDHVPLKVKTCKAESLFRQRFFASAYFKIELSCPYLWTVINCITYKETNYQRMEYNILFIYEIITLCKLTVQ